MKRYYYSHGGDPQGPFDEDDLQRLLGEGTVGPETMVNEEGSGVWEPLSQVLGLVATSPTEFRPRSQAPAAPTGKGSIADELKKLHDLRQSGALTEAEFQRAKEALLGGGQRRGDAEVATTDSQVARLRLETELLRLEQEWQTERQQFFVSGGRYSYPAPPSSFGLVMSILVAVFVVLFGIFWMSTAANAGAPGLFPLFGLVIVGIAVAFPFYYGYRYSAYNKAYERYQRRRADVVSKLNEIDR
jgi:hypothetical protein